MAMSHRCFMYILASASRTLYVGITNDLARRVHEHRDGRPGAFTSKYNIGRLVYFEEYDGPLAAIAREKEVKRWRREKKLRLVESMNPKWIDLTEQI
ncbi:MAG: GIY-YIG nuclease family protein [Candidatus Binataceae bacterium]